VLDSRRERLAAALRDNLRKRKAQARVRVHNAVDEVSEAIDDVLGPVDGDKVPT